MVSLLSSRHLEWLCCCHTPEEIGHGPGLQSVRQQRIEAACNAWLAGHVGIQRQYAMGQFPIGHMKRQGGLDYRFRWDVFTAAVDARWVKDVLYAYANDEHVDGVLQIIFAGKMPSNTC